jgi:hypothetical protein
MAPDKHLTPTTHHQARPGERVAAVIPVSVGRTPHIGPADVLGVLPTGNVRCRGVSGHETGAEFEVGPDQIDPNAAALYHRLSTPPLFRRPP